MFVVCRNCSLYSIHISRGRGNIRKALPDGQFFNDEQTTSLHSTIAHSSRGSASFAEEKKSMEDEMAVDSANDPASPSMVPSTDTMKTGEEDFTPIKRDGYKLGVQSAGSPTSPRSTTSNQSPAMRGAQEIIRKKRLKRMEM